LTYNGRFIHISGHASARSSARQGKETTFIPLCHATNRQIVEWDVISGRCDKWKHARFAFRNLTRPLLINHIYYMLSVWLEHWRSPQPKTLT